MAGDATPAASPLIASGVWPSAAAGTEPHKVEEVEAGGNGDAALSAKATIAWAAAVTTTACAAAWCAARAASKAAVAAARGTAGVYPGGLGALPRSLHGDWESTGGPEAPEPGGGGGAYAECCEGSGCCGGGS